MLKNIINNYPAAVFAVILSVIFVSCEANVTGVEESPTPGVVRVTLRANPQDNYVIERTDTFSVFVPWDTSSFYVNIFQGSVFSGEKFALLFTSLESYRQEDKSYDLFEQNTSTADLQDLFDKLDNNEIVLDTMTADFVEYTIFESYIPPGSYDKLRMGVGVPTDLAKSRVTLVSTKGKINNIPLELPPDASLLKEFEVDFNVKAGEVTEINLQLSPFESISRYKDSYRFNRIMKVLQVQYPD